MKPIIGINVDMAHSEPNKCFIEYKYVNSIIAAGGVPHLLPAVPVEDIPRLVAATDGIMLIGGDDYDPSFYGHDVSEHTEIGVRRRQDFDLNLAQYILKQTKLPVLGVCAGCQIANIALGGTIIQDVPSHVPESQINHSHNNWSFSDHDVFLSADSKLARIYGREVVSTPTWHHQSVGQPGEGFNAVGHAADGILEAIELSGPRFVLGVQWHPEHRVDEHLCLFQAFVDAARAHMANVQTRETIPAR